MLGWGAEPRSSSSRPYAGNGLCITSSPLSSLCHSVARWADSWCRTDSRFSLTLRAHYVHQHPFPLSNAVTHGLNTNTPLTWDNQPVSGHRWTQPGYPTRSRAWCQASPAVGCDVPHSVKTPVDTWGKHLGGHTSCGSSRYWMAVAQPREDVSPWMDTLSI